MIKNFLTLHHASSYYDQSIEKWAGSILSLAIRLYVGWQFFKAGLTKISDWSATLALFRDEYHVPLLPPELAALMGASGELILPLLLALGLLCRPAALGLLVVNVMAVISYPQLFKFECPAGWQDHFYWSILLLVLFAFGAGRISLDAMLGKRFNA